MNPAGREIAAKRLFFAASASTFLIRARRFDSGRGHCRALRQVLFAANCHVAAVDRLSAPISAFRSAPPRCRGTCRTHVANRVPRPRPVRAGATAYLAETRARNDELAIRLRHERCCTARPSDHRGLDAFQARRQHRGRPAGAGAPWRYVPRALVSTQAGGTTVGMAGSAGLHDLLGGIPSADYVTLAVTGVGSAASGTVFMQYDRHARRKARRVRGPSSTFAQRLSGGQQAALNPPRPGRR